MMIPFNTYACSCWDLSMEGKPYVIFKVVSGDSIQQYPGERRKHREKEFLKTLVEVVESDTLKRKVGDKFFISQRAGGCRQSFSPPFHYYLYNDSGAKEESANQCSIEFKEYDGMDSAQEKWIRNVLEGKTNNEK